ncbi:carboxypeptidase-like regulatory domain-containing protein [Edaphobacter paludis]|uniref:Carboxypeptidase-like regulatory domain-containing protein n=1 Tax=Edaphobacter paludis TaxID=3035702 RepID=A0AAU7CXJ8_9BACT
MSLRRRSFSSFLVLSFLAFSCAFSPLLKAQLSTTATITGTVTDETGAVIPDATVTITDLGTKAVTVRQSNSDGNFTVPGLPVSNYSVSIVKDGFQTYSVTGIALHPAVTATINGILKTGTTSTSVTVSADAVQVETATIDHSASVDAAQVNTLPLNGRNYQSLSSLMPGVQNTSAGSALTTGGRSTSNTLSVNGLAQSRTFYALDGVWNENTGNMAQTSVVPNPDSLDEVRVLQNNYSAKYSLMGSSVVLLQTKSGTSSFHGTAWEFLRNDALNSKPYFAKSVLPYKQNIFGYTIGGPLFIPKIYNTNKQKTFFFWSQQFVILHQVPSNLTGTTPTANQRAGIFNSPIVDPNTGLLVPKNGHGQYVIPSSEINGNSTAFLNALYPLPNFSNGTSTNYINPKGQITNQRDDEIKINHNFNSRFQLLGEYFDEYQSFAQNSLSGSNGTSVFDTNSETDLTHNKLAQVSLTSIITPNMVNTTSIAMNIFDLDLNLEGTAYTNQVPGFQTTLPYSGFLSNRLPLVSFSGGIGSEGIAASRPLTHAAGLDDTVGDDWSYLHGRHYLQAGFTLVFNTKRQNVGSATNGQFTFSGNFTKPGSGAVTQDDALADFLFGRATTFTQTSNQPRLAIHGAEFSPYFEDRFKMTKDLTLTAGVRVYHAPLPYGPPQSETNFVPSVFDPIKAPIVNSNGTITPTTNYSALNGLVLNGANGIPNNFSNQHVWYVGPVAGFAWDVFGNGKTSIRGGYGITYTRIFTNQDCSFACGTNPPAITSANLQNPQFPNPVGTGSAKAATIASLSAANQNVQSTSVQSFSLSLEHEIAHNWIGSATYAGSIARHLVGQSNINLAPAYSDATGNYDFNPAINTGAASAYAPQTNGTALTNSPFQGYAAINSYETQQSQNWNALELSVRHPVTTNLFLTVAYTYSKDLTDQSSQPGSALTTVDPYHPSRYYGNAEGLNFPHSLAITAIYNLPWLQDSKGVKRFAFAGWKLSDITTLRSGTSATPFLSISKQGNGLRPDRVPGVSIHGPKTQKEWFNTAAFVAPKAGFYGNAATGSIQGPGLIDFDMALYKDFHINESNFFEFRGEAFNVLNHTNFTTINTTYGNASYGNATAAADPRILEVALRYHF